MQVVSNAGPLIALARIGQLALLPAIYGEITIPAAVYATVLADYAKWDCREGYRGRAALHLCEGLLRASLARGRLLNGLLLGVFGGKV